MASMGRCASHANICAVIPYTHTLSPLAIKKWTLSLYISSVILIQCDMHFRASEIVHSARAERLLSTYIRYSNKHRESQSIRGISHKNTHSHTLWQWRNWRPIWCIVLSTWLSTQMNLVARMLFFCWLVLGRLCYCNTSIHGSVFVAHSRHICYMQNCKHRYTRMLCRKCTTQFRVWLRGR